MRLRAPRSAQKKPRIFHLYGLWTQAVRRYNEYILSQMPLGAAPVNRKARAGLKRPRRAGYYGPLSGAEDVHAYWQTKGHNKAQELR